MQIPNTWKICALQNKWNNKKLIEETDKLTKAAERHDLKPIWGYQKTSRKQTPRNTQHSTKKKEEPRKIQKK